MISHLKLLFVIFFPLPFRLKNDIFQSIANIYILSCRLLDDGDVLLFQTKRQYCSVQFILSVSLSLLAICTIISISRRRLRLARIRMVGKHSASDIGFVYVSLIETNKKKKTKKKERLPLSLSSAHNSFCLEEKKTDIRNPLLYLRCFLRQSYDLFFNKVC